MTFPLEKNRSSLLHLLSPAWWTLSPGDMFCPLLLWVSLPAVMFLVTLKLGSHMSFRMPPGQSLQVSRAWCLSSVLCSLPKCGGPISLLASVQEHLVIDVPYNALNVIHDHWSGAIQKRKTERCQRESPKSSLTPCSSHREWRCRRPGGTDRVCKPCPPFPAQHKLQPLARSLFIQRLSSSVRFTTLEFFITVGGCFIMSV